MAKNKSASPVSTPSAVQMSSSDVSLTISCQAPGFLDAAGRMIEPDPLAQTWIELKEAFSRLHGQRLLELMTRMLHEIPKGEKVRLEWESDEQSFFFLRFDNGWSLGEDTRNPDEPSEHRYEFPSNNPAPKWFPRDQEGFNTWRGWLSLLSGWTIDPNVDHVAQERLLKVSQQLDGLSTNDLPKIAQELVGPDWISALDHIAISGAVPALEAPAAKKRRL